MHMVCEHVGPHCTAHHLGQACCETVPVDQVAALASLHEPSAEVVKVQKVVPVLVKIDTQTSSVQQAPSPQTIEHWGRSHLSSEHVWYGSFLGLACSGAHCWRRSLPVLCVAHHRLTKSTLGSACASFAPMP